jgi:hypothetical protein
MALNISGNGHLQNVQRFEKVCGILNECGDDYNPSVGEICLENMQTYLSELSQNLNDIYTAQADYQYVDNERKLLYIEMLRTAREAVQALKVYGHQHIADADINAILARIAGRNRKDRVASGVKNVDPETSERNNCRVVRYRSYGMRLMAFESLVELIEKVEVYNPVNSTIRVNELKKLAEKVLQVNMAVIEVHHRLTQYQVTRNWLLYAVNNGAVARVKMVKKYIKGLYGDHSQLYRELSGIRFSQHYKM